jgi:pimeloyl-ACP methyl ester carboxylesterase
MNESHHTFLVGRGAESIAHPGGTLLSHLQRTAAQLEAWGADRVLATAGLFHAAYGTQGFPHALLDLRAREELRIVIGDEAEAVVHAYCSLDRSHTRTRDGELRDRFSGDYWVPSERMRRQLAELTVANELDLAARTALAPDERAAVFAVMFDRAAHLSQASWSALSAAALTSGLHAPAVRPHGDRALAYRDLGARGAHVLLWHGGAGPELTWSRQHALADEFRVRIPWRRGFAPSAASVRQDWEPDVCDLLRIMSDRTHVIAHSYGGVSAVLAAARAPERFASLVVIEAPLRLGSADDLELQQLNALARAFARGAPDAREAFLALAGLPIDHPQTARTERLARNFRDPTEATPDFERVRRAGLPVAIASGAHNGAIERSCDALGRELEAERWVLPGAGHAVQRTAAFDERLRAFLVRKAGGPIP